ncbi:MAG: glutamyl-tRNA reductase [Cyanobacteria bacterium]|nr:glutamyl-tRNA reductase [Cyanobacteriota bacterium]
MHIVVAGVRHKTAPIEIREKFALSDMEVESSIPLLLKLPGIQECAILTTCNRTEVYVVTNQSEIGMESIRTFFKNVKNVDMDEYRSSMFTLMHEDAVTHLFRVASGLDSLILGEGQILAQVKETLATAIRLKSNGVVVDKLFKAALKVGKRVRSETGIASRDISVSQAAFDFAKTTFPSLLDENILVVGGGKMAEILLSSLKSAMTPSQAKNITLINRSESRLNTLKEKFNLQGETWDSLPTKLETATVVFVATGAPHIVLDTSDFKESYPKLIIDISVPRNVSPEVGDLAGLQLLNTDDLTGVSGFSIENVEVLKGQATQLIQEELLEFLQWFISLPVVVPTITLLRSKVETIRKAEASCACPVTGTSCSVIDNLSKNLVNKILHDPTVRLKTTQNLEEIYQQAAMLSHLFNFDSANGSSDSKSNESFQDENFSETPTEPINLSSLSQMTSSQMPSALGALSSSLS